VKILHDTGGGVTKESLDFWDKVKNLYDVQWLDIYITFGRHFSFEIFGIDNKSNESVILLLSGCNCGYGGEGPHGSLKIVKELNPTIDENLIFGNKNIHLDLR